MSGLFAIIGESQEALNAWGGGVQRTSPAAVRARQSGHRHAPIPRSKIEYALTSSPPPSAAAAAASAASSASRASSQDSSARPDSCNNPSHRRRQTPAFQPL
jgi:hypothetical protein